MGNWHAWRTDGSALPGDVEVVRKALQETVHRGGGAVLAAAVHRVPLEDGAVVEVTLLASHLSASRVQARVNSRTRRITLGSPPVGPTAPPLS